MKKFIVVILLQVMFNSVHSQQRLVLNQNVYITITNNAYLVLDNANTNAITTLGVGGNIISEGEFNRVKWNIGTTVGNYIVPFSKNVGNKIPLHLTIATAGIGVGSILFSTYCGLTWDNETYMPTGVTNMSGASLLNNSSHVIDRFWIIDALGYATKPTPNILFTYIDAEHSAGGNVINEAVLFAQRYKPAPSNDWGGWYGPFGTVNTVLNTVTSGTIDVTNFHRIWTLVDQNYILPIELLYFMAQCTNNNQIVFEWATATESNNQLFSIEASEDGINWNNIYTTSGAGNSTSIVYYVYTFNVSSIYSYFRLKQADFDGISTYSEIINSACDGKINEPISIYPNPNNGQINVLLPNLVNEKICVQITNAIGQDLFNKMINPDNNHFIEEISLEHFARGIYFITLTTSAKLLTKKIIVE